MVEGDPKREFRLIGENVIECTHECPNSKLGEPGMTSYISPAILLIEEKNRTICVAPEAPLIEEEKPHSPIDNIPLSSFRTCKIKTPLFKEQLI